MVIKSTQKIIKVGDSAGVTIPAKELKRSGLAIGDSVEFSFKKVKQTKSAENKVVIDAAKKILKDYKQDFDNLAKR